LLALERVVIEGPIRNFRRIAALALEADSDPEVIALAAFLRAAHHADRIADGHARSADLVGAVPPHRLLNTRGDERHDVRLRLGVDVLVRNDFQPLAHHRVEALAGVDQLARELHGLTLHAAPDALLHRRDAGHRGKAVLGRGYHLACSK